MLFSAQVAVLVLAAMGRFTLWGAVLVDVGTALAVIANSLLLLRKKLRPGCSRSGGGGSCRSNLAVATATDGGQDGGGQEGSCCTDTRSRGRSHPGDDDSSTCCSSRSPAPTATRDSCLDSSCQHDGSSCHVSARPKAAARAGSGYSSSKRCSSSSSTCCPSSAATAVAAAGASPGRREPSSCSGAVAAADVAVDPDAPVQVAAAPCCRRSSHRAGDAHP